MDLGLRQTVTDALVRLGMAHRPIVGGGLEVTVPLALRARFRDRGVLRLAFDAERWQHDREAELVAVGSPFLTGLEEALRDAGAVSVRIGGELAVDRGVLEAWQSRLIVLNGTAIEPVHHVTTDTLVRVTFEVELPGDESRTEVVPVGWHESGGVVSPQELASWMDDTWYTAAEMAHVLGDIGRVGAELVEAAREAAVDELQRRVGPLVGQRTAGRGRALDQQERRYRLEAEARRREVGDDAARLREIDEEEQARLAQVTAARSATWRATERTIEVLRRGKVDLAMAFARSDARRVIVPVLRTRGGRIRADLCGSCTQARERYFLAPDVAPSRLLCDDCATRCSAADCIELLAKRGAGTCEGCVGPRYCSTHTLACDTCGSTACPEHGRAADCCGGWLCGEHASTGRGGQVLCSAHGAACAVDGLLTHVDDLVTCPISGRRLYGGNAVSVPGDGRWLDPDSVVVCGTTAAPVARDRAGRCGVDDVWHAAHLLAPVDGEVLCPAHRVEVEVPAGRWVRWDHVLRCAETGATLAPEAAQVCSMSGEVYDRQRTVQCPITTRWLHVDRAVRVQGTIDCCTRTPSSSAARPGSRRPGTGRRSAPWMGCGTRPTSWRRCRARRCVRRTGWRSMSPRECSFDATGSWSAARRARSSRQRRPRPVRSPECGSTGASSSSALSQKSGYGPRARSDRPGTIGCCIRTR
ncbi:MAG: hypothetical protein R3F59_21880 [Myxococcota bacterium]